MELSQNAWDVYSNVEKKQFLFLILYMGTQDTGMFVVLLALGFAVQDDFSINDCLAVCKSYKYLGNVCEDMDNEHCP